MLKKLVIVAVVGFVAVAAVKGTKVGSYLRSEFDSIREQAEASIPPEKEIARLRTEIKNLDKDLMTVVNQVAKERVEIGELKEKANELRAKQSQDKEVLQSRADTIRNATAKAGPDKSGKEEYVVFGDRKLSVASAKAELELGVRRYAANQKSLESMDTTVSSRERIKDSLEKQLDTLKNQKNELMAQVDTLEAELTSLKLQQMESKYQTDDTRLAKIKEDIRALKSKMDIEREKLKLLPSALESSTTSYSSKSVDDIMAPLSNPTKSSETKTSGIE
jgi:chromosome segregation ATPase